MARDLRSFVDHCAPSFSSQSGNDSDITARLPDLVAFFTVPTPPKDIRPWFQPLWDKHSVHNLEILAAQNQALTNKAPALSVQQHKLFILPAQHFAHQSYQCTFWGQGTSVLALRHGRNVELGSVTTLILLGRYRRSHMCLLAHIHRTSSHVFCPTFKIETHH